MRFLKIALIDVLPQTVLKLLFSSTQRLFIQLSESPKHRNRHRRNKTSAVNVKIFSARINQHSNAFRPVGDRLLASVAQCCTDVHYFSAKKPLVFKCIGFKMDLFTAQCYFSASVQLTSVFFFFVLLRTLLNNTII